MQADVSTSEGVSLLAEQAITGMTEYLTLRAEEAGTDINTARRTCTDGFSVPMGHMGHVDDVARLVIFLASNHARYITGGQYTVDGGMTPSS